ncbi:hypothetical protein BD309DRAFT_724391 [Dichomitus squalens]|nr:hypothetical protein BD309DRAFT_724391 [Dichomitus squalens]
MCILLALLLLVPSASPRRRDTALALIPVTADTIISYSYDTATTPPHMHYQMYITTALQLGALLPPPNTIDLGASCVWARPIHVLYRRGQ